jgi:hypothetical protein
MAIAMLVFRPDILFSCLSRAARPRSQLAHLHQALIDKFEADRNPVTGSAIAYGDLIERGGTAIFLIVKPAHDA